MHDYLSPTVRSYFDAKRAKLPNAELRIFDRKLPDPTNAIRAVHITGICGTATASLAKLFQDQGITVTGSDQACYPPMSTVLQDMQIPVLPFDVKNCQEKDLVIIANMCPPANIEAAFCRENSIPHLSMSEAIREYCIRDAKSIVVAGTHGKTTTTGMMIDTLQNLGEHPSFLVGGVNQKTGSSAHFVNNASYFVIEGDEYDTAYFDKSPKFLHYKPNLVVITTLELDHIDIYESLEDYTNSFRFLIHTTDPNGKILLGIDDPGVYSLFQEFKNDPRIIPYGNHPEALLRYDGVSTNSGGQRGEISWQGDTLGTLSLPHFGEYNFQNALAVFGICHAEGFAPGEIFAAIQKFSGMKRRQEIVGAVNGITVIDDFAHHPKAVSVTLHGIRERFPGHRIVALFEPRSNSSRGKIFEKEYKKSFVDADMVVISAPKPKDGYNPDEFMDIDAVVKEIINSGKEAYSCENANEVLERIPSKLKSEDIVVIMSNGSFDGIHQKLLDLLAKR